MAIVCFKLFYYCTQYRDRLLIGNKYKVLIINTINITITTYLVPNDYYYYHKLTIPINKLTQLRASLTDKSNNIVLFIININY